MFHRKHTHTHTHKRIHNRYTKQKNCEKVDGCRFAQYASALDSNLQNDQIEHFLMLAVSDLVELGIKNENDAKDLKTFMNKLWQKKIKANKQRNSYEDIRLVDDNNDKMAASDNSVMAVHGSLHSHSNSQSHLSSQQAQRSQYLGGSQNMHQKKESKVSVIEYNSKLRLDGYNDHNYNNNNDNNDNYNNDNDNDNDNRMRNMSDDRMSETSSIGNIVNQMMPSQNDLPPAVRDSVRFGNNIPLMGGSHNNMNNTGIGIGAGEQSPQSYNHSNQSHNSYKKAVANAKLFKKNKNKNKNIKNSPSSNVSANSLPEPNYQQQHRLSSAVPQDYRDAWSHGLLESVLYFVCFCFGFFWFFFCFFWFFWFCFLSLFWCKLGGWIGGVVLCVVCKGVKSMDMA